MKKNGMKVSERVGYTIIFSTGLPDEVIGECLDTFLRKVSDREQISTVLELTEKECYKQLKKFLD